MSQTLRKIQQPCLLIDLPQYACVLVSFAKAIAFHARTLGGNVHSCTKLFNMLNIRRSWHARRKSLKTAPHTGGTSLRQLSRVTISSADSSSVRWALREDDWFKEMGRMKVLKYLWGDKKVKEDEAVKEKYLDPLTKGASAFHTQKVSK